MHKFLLLICSIASLNFLFAQSHNGAASLHHQSILSVQFLSNDFATAAYLNNHSIGNTLHNWTQLKDMSYGLGLEYLQSCLDKIDFSVRTDASFAKFSISNRLPSSQSKLLIETDAGFNFKLLSDKHTIAPYLHAGIGGSVYNTDIGAYIPFGAGLQFKINKGDVFIFANSQYRLHLTKNAADHFNYSVAVGGLLTKHNIAKLVFYPLPAIIDTDGDGIIDGNDSCKTVPGILKYKGCPIPDSDQDGIRDDSDRCPFQPGLAKYGGCPIPDTDGDGINDEVDSCPAQPGLIKYKGCPIPDSDGDGVNDERDSCPTVPGVLSNNGCPEKTQVIQNKIDSLAQQIFFATGSSILLNKSYSPLDKLVVLLEENNDWGMDIEGHTDNKGSNAVNMELSKRRAETVLNYLIKKGISKSRLQAKGYGSTIPVADNYKVEGRALNRRVELKIRRL